MHLSNLYKIGHHQQHTSFISLKLKANRASIIFFEQMENEYSSKTSIEGCSQRLTNFQFQDRPPLLRNIENLLIEEAHLELSLPGPFKNEALVNCYKELTLQLKVDLKKAARSRWDPNCEGEQVTLLEEKIRSTINRMRKLKEVNVYFQELRKQEAELERDVEKFMFYTPKEQNLCKEIEDFISEPIVSELIFKEYEKSFNPNNFLAEIIQFFDFQSQHRLLPLPPEDPCQWTRNSDLLLIENATIIFRQICEISDKYSLVDQQLREAYIHLDFLRTRDEQLGEKDLRYSQQTQAVETKMKQLTLVAHKIKRHAGTFNILSLKDETIILPEEEEVFETIKQQFQYCLGQRNETFFSFLEELYDGKESFESNSEGKFDFLRHKIIKTEMRWHLNRLFSSLNVGSHIASKVVDNVVPRPKNYSFKCPSVLIKAQLDSKRMEFYSSREATQRELELLSANIEIMEKEEGFVLQTERNKIVYPSALHNYYSLLKYLLCLSTILQQADLYNDELLLEITSIKADEIMQWAQTVINIFDIIKTKFPNCYPTLFSYIQLVFKVDWLEELEYLKRELKGGEEVSKLLSFYSRKEKKARWINQIIFELDSSFDIQEALSKMVEIEERHVRTAHCSDHHQFYELILNEVIETRNNLKFDRVFSFNGLHQLFSFSSAKPHNLRDLAGQLAPLSGKRMRISDLVRFYGCQNRIKREVFKAELYWITYVSPSVKNKFIVTSQKKKVSFRDFLEENAKFLLKIVNESLQYFLDNLEEIQRAVLLFGHEVDRLKLIQSCILLLRPHFPLEDHIAAFNHRELTGFFLFASSFNLVEDIYSRRAKNNGVLSLCQKMISESKFKFSELSMDNNTVALKNMLAGYIFVMHAFGHHYTSADCLALKQAVIDQDKPAEQHLKVEVWRSKRQVLKQYEECQFADLQTLLELVQIYELLLHITIFRVICQEDVPRKDKEGLIALRTGLPSYASFKTLEELQDLEKTKYFSGSSNKSISLCCVKQVLELHRDKCEGWREQRGGWSAVEALFILSKMGIITRRLVCNQLMELKHEVAGEEWKYFNKANCLLQLKTLLDKILVEEVNKFLREDLGSTAELNPNATLAHHITLLAEMARKQIVQDFDNKYPIELHQQTTIVLFDEDRGIEVDSPEEELCQLSGKPHPKKKNRGHFKRGLLNAIKMEDSTATALASELEQKVNLEIVKESLPIRKKIYHMQLEQKRIRDEIAWETCKLEHTVISKINSFIEESNQDQKQSLINFKYTVSLETIKGIENVIHERTEILNKNQEGEQGRFITQPDHPDHPDHTDHTDHIDHPNPDHTDHTDHPNHPEHPQRLNHQDHQESLLDLNIRNVFNHIKKIRVFWGWKQIHIKKHCGDDQWAEFGANAERILHNKENMAKMEKIEQVREDCSRQEMLCNLIKEENHQLNCWIKNIKINHLQSKLQEFRQKHQMEEEEQPTPPQPSLDTQQSIH